MNAKYLLSVAVLLCVVVATSLVGQTPLTHNHGLGWDGTQYAKMVESCGRERIAADAPFVFRVGAPCLAAALSSQPLQGLFIVNLAASILAVCLLAYWLGGHISDWRIRWLLVAMYALQWNGPLRFAFWYPAQPDPTFHVVILLGLILFERERSVVALSALTFVGMFFRETTLLLPFALAVSKWPDWRRAIRGSGPVFAAGLAGYAVTHYIAQPTAQFGFLGTAVYRAYVRSVPVYLHAVFLAYGPAIALLLAFPNRAREVLRERKHLAALLYGILFLSWIGGTDTERFMLWAAPIVLVLVGLTLERLEVRRLALPLIGIVLAQLISARAFIPTPDHWPDAPRAWPLLTPFGAKTDEFLVSDSPDFRMAFVSLVQYVIVTAGAAWLLARTQTKGSSAGSALI